MRWSPQQDEALVRRQARNPRAYEHYLRGRALWAKTSGPALLAAIDEYKQAIALDPEYALAYAGLADAYSVLPITSDVPSDEVLGSFVSQFYDSRTPPRLILLSEEIPECELVAEALSIKADRKVETKTETKAPAKTGACS